MLTVTVPEADGRSEVNVNDAGIEEDCVADAAENRAGSAEVTSESTSGGAQYQSTLLKEMADRSSWS